MRRKLLVLMLLFTLTPSAAELVEWAAHFVWHGDFAHADSHADPEDADCHGCSTLFHSCGCHTSRLLSPAVAAANTLGETHASSADHLPAKGHAGRGSEPPPLRPPIG